MNIFSKYYLQIFVIIYCIFLKINVKSQTDDPKIVQVRRILLEQLQKSQNLMSAKPVLQKIIPKSIPFFCDAKLGPGKRSSIRPTSVHQLRPGDIDIIMGMGDSLTAGNGIAGRYLYDILIENRGLSWSAGGQNTWRKFITLPNILKEFNSNLYGYALKTSLSIAKESRFNVAEGGAMSRDMPYQAQVLIQRLKHDQKINMTNDWKVLTILIGANDFCSDICYYKNPENIVKNHEREMLKTLRILRDNIPRLFVNFVVTPDVSILRNLLHKPSQCIRTQLFECACFIGKSINFVNFYGKIIQDWIKKDYEVVYRSEFNTEDFTVTIQPFFTELYIPKFENGSVDYSYMSVDCFHFSQKLHAQVSIALWNNMLEPEGNKTKNFNVNDIVVKCPTEDMQYLKTRENSKN